MASERPPIASGFREDRDDTGAWRPGYAELFESLAEADLSSLRHAVADHLKHRGVSFGGSPFVVDPVPRLLSGVEWDALAGGLAQRARALGRFLDDVYGEQEIVRAGVVSAETIGAAEGFDPRLRGRVPRPGAPAAIAGFDVVRDPGGEFLVLEDNLRTPSGYTYALAAREALIDVLPTGGPRPRAIDPVSYELLHRALRAATPPGVEEPLIVVLSDGPDNVAYFEHRLAAERLGVPLVTLADLVADRDGPLVRPDGGELRRVDVVYRRTDEDRAHDEHGRLTAVGQALVPAWTAGRLGLVNAFGNGVADDKLMHGHVEDFVRFYLGEEPAVRSVPTESVAPERPAPEMIGRLRERVIKPRHGHGGKGVVIGAHADEDELAELAQELERNPGRYVSQPTVTLSRHPTVIDGRLEPRHVDLRAFAFTFSDERVELIPGGLSRVALEAGAMVVNSSQQGGGKDTWVIG